MKNSSSSVDVVVSAVVFIGLVVVTIFVDGTGNAGLIKSSIDRLIKI